MSVVSEMPDRLHWSAERYYFAGILAAAEFNASAVVAHKPRSTWAAAQLALSGPDKKHRLVGPDVVMLAFSVELYLKLLRLMFDGHRARGHELDKLFLDLESVAPAVAAAVVQNHRYAKGNHAEFVDDVVDIAKCFAEWRYGHEKEFLVTSPDVLMAVADALRDTVSQLHPTLKSQFA